MKLRHVQMPRQTLLGSGLRSNASNDPANRNGGSEASRSEHPDHRAVWHTVSALLILTILVLLDSIGWEISMRRFLQG